MQVINNTNISNEIINALVLLPQITAGATGHGDEVDFIVDDGANKWKLSTISTEETLTVNDAYHVEKTGNTSTVGSYTPL